MDLNRQIERAEKLASLMQQVGFAVWHLQALEGTVTTYLVLRLRAVRGVGEEQGTAALGKAERRTFGHVVQELRAAGVLEERLASNLDEVLAERNWLIHRARREYPAVLFNAPQLASLTARLERIADLTDNVNRAFTQEVERHVLSSGIDRATLERETDAVLRQRGLVD